MNTTKETASNPILTNLPQLIPDLEALYKDVHAHPELSMQETRTAGLAADRLRAAGYDVTTGDREDRRRRAACATAKDRPSCCAPTWTRLPVEEATGLPYASKVDATDRDGKTVPVDACLRPRHACRLARRRDDALRASPRRWRGTLMAVFQPAEETAEGAQAMIDDGLFDRFPKPDVVLGQHVMVGPAGAIGGRAGVITSAARQPADPTVRARRTRLDAAGQHRSRGDGGGDGDAPANHRLPRTRRRRGRRGHHRLVAGRHQGERHSRRGRHQAQRAHASTRGCASACSPRSSGSSTPRPRPRARPGRRRSRRSTAIPSSVNDPAASKRVADAFRRHFLRRARARDRTDAGERGLRIVRRRSGTRRPCSGSSAAPTPTATRKPRQAGRLNEIPTNHNPRFRAGYPSDLGRPASRRWSSRRAPGWRHRAADRADPGLESGGSPGLERAQDGNAPAGARSRRHLRLCAERRDGGGQEPARSVRSSGPVVCGGQCRRHCPRPADRRGAAGGDQRLALSGGFAARRHRYLLAAL